MSAVLTILLALAAVWSLAGVVASVVSWLRWPCAEYTENCRIYTLQLILALGFLALALK